MTIETAIQNLADAIHRLCDTEEAGRNGADIAKPEATTEPDPPKRGRPAKPKTDTPAADAQEQPSSADTEVPAPAFTGDVPAAAPAASVATDAGTGKPLTAPAGRGPDYVEAKQKAGRLIQTPGGDAKLTELLRKHSGIAEGEVKLGNVPNEALAALIAEIDAELALAD